jgi:hypothetical protein
MQGTFNFEFIGDFFHELHALWKITVFRQIRKPLDFSRNSRREEAQI